MNSGIHTGLILAGLFVVLLMAATIRPSWLVSGDPLEANSRAAFQAPGHAHWLGMDENGRDVLTRVVYGARSSMLMGLGSTFIGVGFGIALGLIAGLGRRSVDGVIMRFLEILLAVPYLLLALVVITFWGQGMTNAMVAVGVVNVSRYARMVRAQTHVVRRAAYVEAAVALGIRWFTVVRRHVLPNAIKPTLILAAIGIGENIAFGAVLSFLGLGAAPPEPEWGSMLSMGRNYLSNAWWLTAVPATVIMLTVLSVTALGRQLLRHSEAKTS